MYVCTNVFCSATQWAKTWKKVQLREADCNFQKTFTKFLEVIVQLFVTFVVNFFDIILCVFLVFYLHMIYISSQNNLILFVLDGVFSSLSKQNQIIQNVVTNWITVAIRFIQSIIYWGQKKVTKLMLPIRSCSSDVRDNRKENRVLGQLGTRKIQ